MTATYERPETDFYKTPAWAIERYLARWKGPMPLGVLEPAAGDGVIVDAVRAKWPHAILNAYDIEPRRPDIVSRSAWFDDEPNQYDLVITNPPYNAAEQFVRYGLTKLRPGGRLVLLLRLGFLGSIERKPLWQQHMAEDVMVLSERPSFKAGKTDFSEYAWYVWRNTGRRRSFFRGSIL